MIAAIGLGEILWALLVLFVMVQVLVATVAVLWDLVRSPDLSGAAKAAWIVGFVVLPLVTVVGYLLLRGDGIGDRQRAREVLPPPPTSTVPAGAPAPGVASELRVARTLLDDGSIGPDDFDVIKRRLLAET